MSAYSERSANYILSIDGNWSDPAEDQKVISWVRNTWAEFAPYGTGGVYLNFRSLADESEDSDVENTFGDNMRRLAEVKAKYDPTNFFRRNNNITPAG